MHDLINYVCEELDKYDKKAKKGMTITANELAYVKDLAACKKDLLKGEKLSKEDNEQSFRRRDSMGRYASEGDYSGDYSRGYSRNSYDSLEKHLEDMARSEHDERKRREIEDMLDKVHRM